MAKIKLITLDTPYSEIKEMCKSHSANILLIKGTDALIFLDDRSPFFYSKKVEMRGSSADSYNFNDFIRKKGFGFSYGLFEKSDWDLCKRKTKREVFSKTEHRRTKKVVSEYDKYKTTGRLKKQKYPEYGVELELESDVSMSMDSKKEIRDFGGKLIQDVGGDPSVKGGTEIRFNHPAMSGWKYRDVSKLLKFCKTKGALTKYGTAGMHIHISRPDIETVVKNFKSNLSAMQDILYPINCRKQKLYDGREMYFGVHDNIYRDQLHDFGTLEIRAWNATLNPKLFMARIKFCKTFTEWLAKTKVVSVESFFDFMNAQEKANYSYMLNHKENPHEWGFPPKAINALLAA